MKDRLARAYVSSYQLAAQYWKDSIREDPARHKERIKYHVVPRYSIITSGNAGLALARAFQERELPPPKLLLDKKIPPHILEKLRTTGADIYLVDLSKNPFSGRSSQEDPLTPQQILKLTNNIGGKDITSSNVNFVITDYDNPSFISYASLAKEVFGQQPNEVYVPYGSGMVFECFLYMQRIYGDGKTSIFGAEPVAVDSVADKLIAPAKPFKHFDASAIRERIDHQETGLNTGIFKVDEEDIKKAFHIIQEKGESLSIRAEPSAVVGLALYMKRWKAGLISPDTRVLVINTGKGIE